VDLLLAAAQLLMADTTAPDPGAAARARLAARGAAAVGADVVPPAPVTAGQAPPAAEAGAVTEQQLRQGKWSKQGLVLVLRKEGQSLR
jgi:hypothetical protein